MEAVAADAAFVEFARQRKAPGPRRQGVVERGVEAGDLRKLGAQPDQCADACQAVGLMQGLSGIRASSAAKTCSSTRSGWL